MGENEVVNVRPQQIKFDTNIPVID